MLRDDLNHPVVSGNKLHKLAPNIELAKANHCTGALSFGGPYSNHLHALAWACKDAGLASTGIVRGELQEALTPTLLDCRAWGMTLVACSRKDYRAYQDTLSQQAAPCFANDLPPEWVQGNPKKTLVIPEGGSNAIAIESLATAYKTALAQPDGRDITHIVCPTGTGATLTGVLNAAPTHIKLIGMQAVAEGDATLRRIEQWYGGSAENLTIQACHLGRFGKITTELKTFIGEFEREFGIPLDPVYNGKAMLELTKMIDAGHFNTEDTLLFIHTGGLQGKRHA